LNCHQNPVNSQRARENKECSKKPYNVKLATPTRLEILKAINALKNNKAPGQDDLSSKIYKQYPQITSEQLHGILEELGRTTTFPRDWKTSVTLPICKKADTIECKNYQGISLIDIVVNFS